MSPEQIDRSVLAGKDRDELHTIASAIGVKAATRMRKADLVEAIMGVVDGGNGSSDKAEKGDKVERAPRASSRAARSDDSDRASENGSVDEGAEGQAAGPSADASKPRRVRSARASELKAHDESLAALAAEEDSLGGDGGDLDVMPRPRRRPAESAPPAESVPSAESASSAESAAPAESARNDDNGGNDDNGSGARTQQPGNQGNQHQGSQGNQHGDDFGDGNRRGRRRRRGRGGQEQGEPRSGNEPRGNEPRQQDFQGEPIPVQGLLDLRDEGYGFLRCGGYLPGSKDVYVSASQVRRFALRKGDYVRGASRPQASNEKYPAMLRVDEINGMTPDEARNRVKFEDLTPLFPDSKLRLELTDEPAEITGRIVDLISPIGKGQRGLIVSPPKAGKTTILKQLVYAIERNNPEVHLMVLLVDERPEEVTDMKRHVVRGEVVASTFDRPSDEHTHVAELTIERAKRLVELGKDVVIVLDGITRLARAYNLAAPTSGRIMSGGVDSSALYPPKKFFGAARNIEEGGSLTIVATALVETGSRMDEVIFEEFKGTGNMELRLDRRLAERRIYPSIDPQGSSTRHDELLFDRTQLQQVWKLRRVLNALEEGKGLELLIDKIRTTRSNDEFLAEIAKNPSAGG